MYIVLGVSGSIAAYKAADMASEWRKHGHDVHVILTEGGSKFITPLTLQTLSRNRVHTDFFETGIADEVKHINMADKADVIVIAPASADIISKIACGIADDVLTTTVLAAMTRKKIVICPAMNTNMYRNPILQEHIEKLKGLGVEFINPKDDDLACGIKGEGALADVYDIVEEIEKLDK